jgi:hypothetical protein
MFGTHAGAEHVNDVLLWNVRGLILIVRQKIVSK